MAKAINLEDIKNEAVDLENIPIEEVFEQLKCSREGLTSDEGANRLNLFGPNKLEEKKESKFLKFLGFMWNPLSWVMEAAAIMAIALANGGGKPPDWQDFVGIVCLLVINSTISFIEENNAGNAAAALMANLAPKCKVLRDGRWGEQEAAILVPGDIISIKLGDIIPADARLLEGDPLKVDQSALTGESLPVTKSPGDEVFSGSTCKQGEIEAIVIATGVHTFFGKAAHLVDSTNQVGHFQKVLTAIGNFCIVSIAVGMVIEIIVMYPIQRRAYRSGINNLLVLLIGGIPIAMPTVLSVTMAIGSHKLSTQGAITKRMTAIEEMAGMDVLCSDKTGTLTLNKLSVDKNLIEVFCKGVDKEHVLLLAARASRVENQDAIDACMVGMLSDPKEARAGIREVHFLPFNPVDKRTALTYIDASGNWHRVSKGAPEQILDLANCREDVRKKVHAVIEKFAERGLRSLGVARQEVPEKNKDSPGAPWQFVGLLPLFDPPRHDSADTIRKALNLGVNVKMITGDQLAIGKETGRRLGMGTNMYPSAALLGQDKDQSIGALPVDELIEKADGFAGVFPEHKYEIVKKLQEKKHIVGMTGDGVNDAPALKKADIGIAVDDATDAARSASDIVLTEPGLSVIISAVLTSRAIFQRMKNYTIYAVSITIRIVLGFMLIALIWKFDFSPFMVLIIAILNDGTIMTISKDRVKPSPLPDSWKLKEIFATGIVLGGYLGIMTVIFFWAMHKTDFFSDKFGVRSLRGSPNEEMAALYLQVSIVSQALIFVTRSRSWSYVERPGALLFTAFLIAQLVATLIAVYANWGFADIKGCGWGWAGVVWLYNIVFYVPLDILKFAIRYILSGKAWLNLFESKTAWSQLLQSISDVFKKRERAYLKKLTIDELKSLLSEYDSESDTYRMPFLQLPPDVMSCEGMVLITSLLCSCIRNIKFPQLRCSCILLLKSSSVYIDDEDRLQRVLPYVIAMLSDAAAIVRCAALETLCDILPLVQEFPPSDAKIFPEYILPMLSMLPDDPEETVRICYASNISKLALTSYGFLVRSIRMSEAGVLDELSTTQKSFAPSTENGEALKINSNAQLAHLRKSIAEVVQELVMGPRQTPNIRRALLQDIAGLCCFFGQRQSNDFLLPILPAFLNDRDEQLRTVFYWQIVYVCFFVGQRSVEEYLLPYIEQALGDTTEGVIVNTLDCLTILCKSGFLRKRVLLEMIQHSFLLLCYPSQWVRRAVVSFMAASSESLGDVDSYVFLAPVVRPFLRRQPASLASERAVLSCLKPPVSRQIFYQVLDNSRGSDMLERQRKIWYNTSTQPKQWETMDLLKRDEELLPLKAWPDTRQELQDQKTGGLSADQIETAESDSPEVKLTALRGYIRNASSMLDIRDHLSSEKLQFSGLISAQLTGMSSFLHEKSPENIPLYSFSLDRREVATSHAASDTTLQLNPFNMASSVPPKLVSDSFTIGSGSKQFHRVVHEPEAREADQSSYMNMRSKFQDLGISSSKATSMSSEDVSSGSEIGSPSLSWASSLPDGGWRPRGVLVAHLQEHRSAVNDIAVSTDHSFFVSASDDSTVKVWDSRRLEKDISFRSRLTYPLEGSRALCITMLRGSTQVVVGACDGSIHMFSVDYISRGLGNVIEKYSGIADVKKKDVGEGAILSIVNYSAEASANNMVMYSTRNCGIHLWDTRARTDSWTLKAPPEEGYVSTLVTDPCANWFVSGSSTGVLTLWDLRFRVPVNSWEYPRPCPIENMCLYVPPPNQPFSAMARPLIYVAAGCNEVSLWNAETGSCHQVFRVLGNDGDAEMSDLPWALARPPMKANPKSDPRRNVNLKYRVDELNEPPPRLSGIRSLIPLPGGDLLTGGTDLKIRRWDHSRPERSYCILGPTIKGLKNDEVYESKSSFGVQVVQEMRRRPLTTKLTTKAVLAAAAVDSAGCHRDSILSLASVKLNQRLLISSGRDGAIKVWK